MKDELRILLHKHTEGIGDGKVGGLGIMCRYDHEEDDAFIPDELLNDLIAFLRTHNEKIARAALETGFAQGYLREGFGSKQEYDEYVEMKLSDFLQSPEYKELVGEEWNQK